MKRILLALALIASVQFAGAQTKSPAEVTKAIESAEAAAQNPKKAANPSTWVNIATKYVDAYNAPVGNIWKGISQQELTFVLKEKPLATEQVNLSGVPYMKNVYSNFDLYFNEGGLLEIIKVTKPYVTGALDKAVEAYMEAYKVDVKGKKTKQIVAGLKDIASKYMEDGLTEYTLGNYGEASVNFEKAGTSIECAPVSEINADAFYNAGITAVLVKENERAIKLFEKCIANDYSGEDGAVYSKIAECYTNLDQKDKAAEYLETGFQKFPQSQSILVGLIKYYLESGKNTDRLFELINAAKENEPNNASLYYVEGNINKQLGRVEDAVAAYAKCATVDPAYEFGYIGIGILYYEAAIEASQKASEEFDNAKYEALLKVIEEDLMNALEPFEKAFETTKNNDIKVSIAEYLKNIYYRFTTKGAEYEAGYNKYNDIVKNGL